MKTKEEIFDEYMQAALTGLLANPWFMENMAEITDGKPHGTAHTLVAETALGYAKTAIELRNKLQLN